MGSSRFLILDDDPHVGRMMQLIGETVGIESRHMIDTSSFLRMVEDWQPTHIAIDLVMPEMDGVEVLQRLGENSCNAHIIITSGVGSRVLEAAARSAGEHGLKIAGMLAKPFSPKVLRDLLVQSAERDAGHATPSLYQSSRRDAAPTSDPSLQELRRALEQHELQLVYQPQIHCATGAPSGFEALVRWIHPVRGVIAPDQFIPLAESRGLIDRLTDQVLVMAIRWHQEHFAESDLTMAVNLSSSTTSQKEAVAGVAGAGDDPGFVDRVTSFCRDGGMVREKLILELTESSAMENPIASLDRLTRLRMKGFQLSIDDFGTGYSSILQLVRLPFSELKIDKSFVMTAVQSAESRAVVESIINLGHSLGLRVVAEGVEDAPTLDFLKNAGCDLAQGYFIAKPMSGDAALDWIRSDAQRSRIVNQQRLLL